MSDLNAFLSQSEPLPEEPAPVAEPETAPESEPSTAQDPVDSRDVPRQSTVPIAALREERAKRRQLQEQVEKMNARWEAMMERMNRIPEAAPEQAPVEEIPSFDSDPIGHLRAVNAKMEKELAELRQETAKRSAVEQQAVQFNQFRSTVDSAEQEFSEKTPDYHDAVGYLYENVKRMAQAMGYSPEQQQQIVSQTAMDLAVRAMRSGQNPAAAAYEAAKAMGWNGGGSSNQRTPPTSLASLPSKRGESGGLPSWDTIAQMDDSEFEKFWQRLEKTMR